MGVGAKRGYSLEASRVPMYTLLMDLSRCPPPSANVTFCIGHKPVEVLQDGPEFSEGRTGY